MKISPALFVVNLFGAFANAAFHAPLGIFLCLANAVAFYAVYKINKTAPEVFL